MCPTKNAQNSVQRAAGKYFPLKVCPVGDSFVLKGTLAGVYAYIVFMIPSTSAVRLAGLEQVCAVTLPWPQLKDTWAALRGRKCLVCSVQVLLLENLV